MPADVWSLLGMLLVTVAILALAWWVTGWIGRRGVAGLPGLARSVGAQSPNELCVLRQIPVGRAERLVLLRLHERLLLLGVAAGSVRLLTELSPEEAGPWLQTPEAAGGDFRSLLHMSTKK